MMSQVAARLNMNAKQLCVSSQLFVLITILTMAMASSRLEAEERPTRPQRYHPVDAKKALQLLKSGNKRFVACEPKHPHEAMNWRNQLEKGQHPHTVVLGCSDSRVTPELIFDQGLGDLFVVRVAGNVVDTDVTASIEYAVDHLDTRLVVVLGHSGCGAVTATINHLRDPDGEPAEVLQLLYQIEPAAFGMPKNLDRKGQVAYAINRNVELAVRRLSRVPDLRRSIKTGKMIIVGAIYDMHTGKVTFREFTDIAIR